MCLKDKLFDSLQEALAVVDRQGRLAGANDAWRCLKKEHAWMGSVENSEAAIDGVAFQKVYSDAGPMLSSMQGVIQSLESEFKQVFPVVREGKLCWLRLRIKALAGGSEMFSLLSLKDVTAQSKAEQDLRESHSLFRCIVEGIGDGVFIYDREGRFLMHNTVFLNLLFSESTPVVGKHISEVFPAQLAQTLLGQNQLVLETGRTIGYELTVDGAHGKRHLLVQKGVYRNHRKEAVGLIGIARDITERKRAEEKLEKSERYFRALIEKNRDAIVILSSQGRITYASPATRELFGFDLDELVGTDVFFWLHPEDVSRARQRFEDAVELPEVSMSIEFRVLCKDGRWKWTESTATNLLQDPSMQAIVLNVRDISERKQAEHDSRRFEAIVQASIDGILSVDMEGRITSWNRGAQRIFGYSEAEMLGVAFKKLTPEDRVNECNEFNESVRCGKAVRDCETVRLGRGGERVAVSLTLSPIQDENRHITGIAVIVRDITERRRLEKEVLEIADFEKHRIGQDLHDDLCQHLVAISMIGNVLYTELVGLGVRQAEHAKQITAMIRNAVDHARILAKGLSPLNIAKGGLLAGLETLVAHTEQMFRVQCCFKHSSTVQIENIEVATHLYRIAQEALHNAVKHSQGTRVVVCLGEDTNAFEITVSDDGVGPPEPQKCPSGGGMGMHTMQYRAHIIGASLEISKNEQGGTSVLCRLPKNCLSPSVLPV